MVTIMGIIPTNHQNTGSPTKPVTSTHKVNNDGTRMKAAKVDSSGDKAGSEEIMVEELFNNEKEKGIHVIEEPRGRPVFKFFLAKGKTGSVMT